MSSLATARVEFNQHAAPGLAAQIGLTESWSGKGSSRFAYFCTDQDFAIVAGAQEGANVELALAFGLTLSDDRNLHLVVPAGSEFSTLQRSAWLTTNRQPTVYVHDGIVVERRDLPTREQTVAALARARKPGQSAAADLAASMTATHLGERAHDVVELVEWATHHPLLDAGHRKSERSWHCMGQRVLSIRGIRGGAQVRAGIHYTSDDKAPAPVTAPTGTPLLKSELDNLKQRVEAGIEDRLHGVFRKPDEHWLQAVIRERPRVVGVEHPALREVPAWRPSANAKQWGRGFIDLVGLDGHGDIRLVETKLAANRDDLLILQGLDYYIWALAYDEPLRVRLGAPKKAKTILHYVIGATTEGKLHLSAYARAQADALDIPWRCQTVTGWFGRPDASAPDKSELLPAGQLP